MCDLGFDSPQLMDGGDGGASQNCNRLVGSHLPSGTPSQKFGECAWEIGRHGLSRSFLYPSLPSHSFSPSRYDGCRVTSGDQFRWGGVRVRIGWQLCVRRAEGDDNRRLTRRRANSVLECTCLLDAKWVRGSERARESGRVGVSLPPWIYIYTVIVVSVCVPHTGRHR